MATGLFHGGGVTTIFLYLLHMNTCYTLSCFLDKTVYTGDNMTLSWTAYDYVNCSWIYQHKYTIASWIEQTKIMYNETYKRRATVTFRGRNADLTIFNFQPDDAGIYTFSTYKKSGIELDYSFCVKCIKNTFTTASITVVEAEKHEKLVSSYSTCLYHYSILVFGLFILNIAFLI
ncbi:protein E52C [Elephant endotheliotropic herpesvirus 5B]|nr:protein E52C [Elephant endotheliotropic herpesvirus 5B]